MELPIFIVKKGNIFSILNSHNNFYLQKLLKYILPITIHWINIIQNEFTIFHPLYLFIKVAKKKPHCVLHRMIYEENSFPQK